MYCIDSSKDKERKMLKCGYDRLSDRSKKLFPQYKENNFLAVSVYSFTLPCVSSHFLASVNKCGVYNFLR